MRRIETYVGQQVYEWMFSAQAQNSMVALSKLAIALFGASTLVNGLACNPTAPASMTVQVGAGEVYQIEPLEATACGTLPQDTAHSILKQGVQLDAYTTPVFAAPSTSGQSINYLIEAQYQDSDISLDPTSDASPVVLQFYNASNPTQPWAGPNNSGATSNTFRDGVVAYQIKAGIAAATGSQVTPTPDTGWVGLWVVTVPYGAVSLNSSSISQYPKSPILPSGILQSVLTGNLIYGIDAGSANTVQANFPVPVATLVDGMAVQVKIAAANTGATTFTPNPGVITAAPVVGAGHQALSGGELIVGGRAKFVWRQDVSTWVLKECTGAAIQIAPGVEPNHAIQLVQAQSNTYGAAVDSGTVNALAVTLSPAPTALSAGMQVTTLNVVATNTGAATLNLNGLGVKPIVLPSGAALSGGEIYAGSAATFVYTGSSWMLQTRLPVSQAGFQNFQSFASSSTWTAPAWCTKAKYRIWAGGGSGGGGSAVGASGSGGAGGGYCEGVATVTPGQTYTITVGAGGAASTPSTNGNAGGSSSFGAIASASGGGGGFTSGSGAQTITPSGGTGSGGANSFNVGGQGGGIGTSMAGGSGGGTYAVSNSGGSGTFPGGASAGGNNAASPAGASGCVLIEW